MLRWGDGALVEMDATGTYGVAARDAAKKYPTRHRTFSHNKELSSPEIKDSKKNNEYHMINNHLDLYWVLQKQRGGRGKD